MTSEFIDIKNYNYRMIMRIREALGYFDNIEVNKNELQKDSPINSKEIQGSKKWTKNYKI